MSSLTGNQIQNSYEGLLKTENNGALTAAETNITDGVGNQTGLYTNSQYGIAGYKGVNQFPQWGIKNEGFDVTQSPMGGSGSTQLTFLDTDDNRTADITQNRFGGMNYINRVEGQSHIFTGTNQNSPIRIDSFNSPNNSNNWYSGYQNSVSNFTISGQNITLSRTDNTDFTITVPSSGGGGGGVTHRTDQFITSGRYDGGNGGSFGFFTNTTLFVPVYLSSGSIGGAAVYSHGPLSATANAVNLSLWSAGTTASNNPGGGYGAPSVLVHNFGNVDTSQTNGLKEITGASVDVAEGLYYMGIGHLGSFDTSFKVYDANQDTRNSLHYVVDTDAGLNVTATNWPAFYDGFTNSQLASTTYASTPYSGSVSITSAKCAMFLKYNS